MGLTGTGLRRTSGAMLFIAFAVGAAVSIAGGAEAEKPESIQITAESMEYFSQDDLLVFSGKAVAVNDDATLSAERMEVTMGEAEDGVENPRQGRIQVIIASENVTFRQIDPETERERFATGERAEYNAEEATVVLTGEPRVWEGKNVLVGKKMTFFLEEHRLLVEGGVGLTVHPEEDREE